ncbi:MAG: MoaD/ThiS family protein [Anaerolineaceae bacterium]|nr:MoaD/ThiS family protein [Anaerolineaceae bacterium]
MTETLSLMKVEIVVFATLRRYMPDLALGETKMIDVSPGALIADVREMLGIPAEQVKIILRNNRHVEADEIVMEGDRIAFIPAVGGG